MGVLSMTTQPVDAAGQHAANWPGLEWLNSGVFFISKSLQITLYNAQACRLLDTTIPAGQTVAMEACLNSDSEEYQMLQTMVSMWREYRDFVVTWETDGRTRHVLLDSYKAIDDAGNLLGMHVVMKDLGNFMTLDQQMQKTDKLATVGKVAAGVAHEIRNPLTTVKGFLQMFERRFAQQNRSDELDYVKVMLEEIGSVENLVSELLFLSKPQKVARSACSMGRLIEEVGQTVKQQAEARKIECSCTVDSLPDLVVDEALIKQALLHLTDNALEAMEAGGALRIHAYTAGGWLKIDISDTGPGIPYYLMDKIFDAFFTTKEHGAGLGLPICQRIIADHGGEIRVSSKGFGTTFSMSLPVQQSLGALSG